MNKARELIYELRGIPDKCWACERSYQHEQLEPEEGGVWWCRGCIEKWEKRYELHWGAGSPITEGGEDGTD